MPDFGQRMKRKTILCQCLDLQPLNSTKQDVRNRTEEKDSAQYLPDQLTVHIGVGGGIGRKMTEWKQFPSSRPHRKKERSLTEVMFQSIYERKKLN